MAWWSPRKQRRLGGRARLIIKRDEVAGLDGKVLLSEIREQLRISAASVCRILKAHRIQPGMSHSIIRNGAEMPAQGCCR
jgi:hypothetical protein